jgi:hypothetical protein
MLAVGPARTAVCRPRAVGDARPSGTVRPRPSTDRRGPAPHLRDARRNEAPSPCPLPRLTPQDRPHLLPRRTRLCTGASPTLERARATTRGRRRCVLARGTRHLLTGLQSVAPRSPASHRRRRSREASPRGRCDRTRPRDGAARWTLPPGRTRSRHGPGEERSGAEPRRAPAYLSINASPRTFLAASRLCTSPDGSPRFHVPAPGVRRATRVAQAALSTAFEMAGP